jgi:hypothetical protein
MQPSPINTTNALLEQLIQLTSNSSSTVQSTIIPPAATTPIWSQMFAYASLALSLVASFCVVLAKQWLGHYKTNRYGRGSLGDQCKQRHHKFQKLTDWAFEDVLKSFAVLLQISLFLFALSLGGAMWTQQRTISILIIATTGCGVLFLCCIIAISLVSPDSPFQTSTSLFIQRITGERREHDTDPTASAMLWILNTSTNPDVHKSVLDLMVTPFVSTELVNKVLSSQLPEKVLDMFKACFGPTADKGNAQAYGRALLDLLYNHPELKDRLQAIIHTWKTCPWVQWRKLYLPQALEECRTLHRQIPDMSYGADMETPLRVAVAACMDGFACPKYHADTYVGLVWQDRLKSEFDLEVDWLLDCAEKFLDINDFDAAGYALFLLAIMKKSSFLDLQPRIIPFLNSTHESPILRHSTLRIACQALNYNNNPPCIPSFSQAVLFAIRSAIPSRHTPMDLLSYRIWPDDSHLKSSSLSDIQRLVLLVLPTPKLNEAVKYTSYCNGLVGFIRTNPRPDSKSAALRIACSARLDLAMAATASDDVQNTIFSVLSPALLTIVDPDRFEADRDSYYLSLIFTLARYPKWRPRLLEDKHIARCIRIIPEFYDHPPPCLFYLAGILLRIRIDRSQQGDAALNTITVKQWWDLMRMAWRVAGYPYDQYQDRYASDVLDDGTEFLEDLVKDTTTYMSMLPDASRRELESLRKGLGDTINRLESRQANENIRAAVRGLKDKVRVRLLRAT